MENRNMKWLLICLAVAGRSVVLGSGENCTKFQDELETACEYPNKLTLISSPNKKQVDGNNCNSEYEKGDWQEQPTVIYPDAEPGKTYTLLNVDPDPPAYEKGQFYLHWLVTNIKGEDFKKGDLTRGYHVQGYYGPAPPAGSGIHRYMFLAFEEEGKEKTKEIEIPSKRSKFELVPWVRRQENLCGPVAGIQFRTKF